MSERIVLVDGFVPIDLLVAELHAGGIATSPVRQGRFPTGPGVVAVLVGPEAGPVDAASLSELPDLQVLMATSVGTNHLPVAAAEQRGIKVLHPVDYCTEEVADHALALIVGLLRSTHAFDGAVRGGKWDFASEMPRRIAGTVVGLFGYGRIARAVAARADALGMRVLATVRAPRTADDGGSIAEFVTFDELLSTCDVLSLHLPLTDETAGTIGAAELAHMRPGSYLVNVSRGALVDETALGEALRSGHLAGAALDVLATEPPSRDDPVLGHRGLVITPHAAWRSPEVAANLARECAALLANALHANKIRKETK